MVNPFTAGTKIRKIQQDVLRPLYTMYPGQEAAKFSWLLVETGRAISHHRPFMEEVCRSHLVAIIFKIIKLLGGADQLTEEDFTRFTSYVNDGGIKAMVKMLLSADKEKTFIDELKREKAFILTENNIRLDYLTLKYDCKNRKFVFIFLI